MTTRTSTNGAVPKKVQAPKPETPEPRQGSERVRESEIYHLTALVHDALEQGERVAYRVYRSENYRGYEPESGYRDEEKILTPEEAVATLEDARRCVNTAAHWLQVLLNHFYMVQVGDKSDSEELPF